MKEGEKEVRVLIGKDFNARTGREGGVGGKGEEGIGEGGRRSKDEKINGKRKKLCSFLGELKRSILNGSVIGDEEGKWTYIEERGETVIDYCIAE